jgi:hypothetical protein
MASFKHNRLLIINNPLAPRLCPELAHEIGLNESLLLLQLEFWQATEGVKRDDGFYWVRKSLRDINRLFCFLSIATINRAVQSLETQKLIITANHNNVRQDMTRWLRLDPEGVGKLRSVAIAGEGVFQNEKPILQNETPVSQNETHSKSKEDLTKIPPIVPPKGDGGNGFDPAKSSRIANRGRGNQRGSPPARARPPELTPIPDKIRVSPETWQQAQKLCPDVDLDTMTTTWRSKRRSSGALSADWEADWLGFMTTCQTNINQSRARMEQSVD